MRMFTFFDRKASSAIRFLVILILLIFILGCKIGSPGTFKMMCIINDTYPNASIYQLPNKEDEFIIITTDKKVYHIDILCSWKNSKISSSAILIYDFCNSHITPVKIFRVIKDN